MYIFITAKRLPPATGGEEGLEEEEKKVGVGGGSIGGNPSRPIQDPHPTKTKNI